MKKCFFLISILLNISFPSHLNPSQENFQNILTNIFFPWDSAMMTNLNNKINEFFYELHGTIKQSKVIAVTSKNKNDILNVLLEYQNIMIPKKIENIIDKLSYKDKISLYYVFSKTFPLQDFVKVLYISEYKMNILSILNYPLYQHIKQFFEKNTPELQIYNYKFNFIPINSNNNNPQIKSMFDKLLAIENINITITFNECFIISQSLKNKNELQKNNYLRQLGLYLMIYEKILDNFNGNIFNDLKNKVLNKWKSFKENNLLEKYGNEVPVNLFNNNKEAISNHDKKFIIGEQNRTLLMLMYNYIY